MSNYNDSVPQRAKGESNADTFQGSLADSERLSQVNSLDLSDTSILMKWTKSERMAEIKRCETVVK